MSPRWMETSSFSTRRRRGLSDGVPAEFLKWATKSKFASHGWTPLSSRSTFVPHKVKRFRQMDKDLSCE